MGDEYCLDEAGIKYLSQYIKVTDEIVKEIEAHARFYHRNARICAWYKSMNDFRSDWCNDMGYREDEIMAQVINHDGQHYGEFMFLKNGCGIVRFAA